MKQKVIITDAVDQACATMLEAKGIQADVRLKLPKEELKAILPEYEGWIIRSGTKITAELIEAATNLKVIGRAGVGVDNVDLDAATRRGVLVMNSPDGNTLSTAEHTCAMMQSLARHLPQAHASLKSGAWERNKFNGTEIFGKTLGVIGAGKIGRAVAERMRGFGMNVLAYDPMLNHAVAERLGIALVSLDELYAQSDLITVHTPLTEETNGLLNRETFAKCKKGVLVVNCARGEIINEADLLEALASGQVGGAALDVYSAEPPGPHLRPLIEHPNVVATPHIAASTKEAQFKVAEEVTAELIEALQGRSVRTSVNSFAIRMAARSEVQSFLKLAEKLGQVAGQLMDGSLQKVVVRCMGDVPKRYSELLSLAVMRGILSKWHSYVNYINASVIAHEMGVVFEEQRSDDAGNFTELLEITFHTSSGIRKLAGTVFVGEDPRMVQIDGFPLEVKPEGHILFYTNVDRPGMVAAVGRILAENQINIATFTLGRSGKGGEAITAVCVDDTITEVVKTQIEAIDGVRNVKVVYVP